MIVSPLSSEHNTLRVLSLVEGWHLRIAPTLDAALILQQREKIAVILYDQDLPGVEWCKGVVALVNSSTPACVILLSFAISERLRLSLLTCGGYDVAQKPIEGKSLSTLVNGSLALVKDINSSPAVQNSVLP